MRIRFAASILAAMLLVGLIPTAIARAQTPVPPVSSTTAPFSPSPVFSADGLALVVYTGSSIADLQAAAGAAGATGVWVQDARGAYQLLVTGSAAPAFLTSAFQAAIPTISGPIAVTLVRPVLPPIVSPSTITLGQDGATIALRVGDTFTLTLGTTYSWSVGPFDTNVLHPVPTFAALPAGTQGMYVAAGAGSTDLTATGGLVCPANQPCPAIARVFRVHLVVTR